MRWWRPCIAAGLSLLPALSAQAQPGAWPLKPVRLVVSSSAGGPYDDVARALDGGERARMRGAGAIRSAQTLP
jgi:tripartite-type tricarboxylate transporter receptor subunit TctC